MGYDVQFVQMPVPTDIIFPINEQDAREIMSNPIRFNDPENARDRLLQLDGTRPGPEGAIDFIGKGMNYARLTVRNDAIHVENNCGALELLKIYHHLLKAYPTLLIFDLQSKQLHSAISYEEWWSRPL